MEKPASISKARKKSPTKSSSKKQTTATKTQSISLEPVADVDYENSALDIFNQGLSSHNSNRGVLSISLLAKRCSSGSNGSSSSPEELMKKLNDVTHIRLDREGITHIDHLELFGSKARNLYLQHTDLGGGVRLAVAVSLLEPYTVDTESLQENSIKVIEGLETLVGLRFLTLSYNHIVKVENLKQLKHLGLLDLSYNQIECLDVDELPTSLSVLSLEGNLCQQQQDYRLTVLNRCPQLCQFDGQRLTANEKRLAGHEVLSESDDSEPEEASRSFHYSKPFDAEVLGVFDDLSTNLFIRCQSRIQQVFNDHAERLVCLEKIRTISGVSTDDRVSTSHSHLLSARLDSPDTTDSSRPATGSTPQPSTPQPSTP